MAAEPSRVDSEVDLMPSRHHSERNSTKQLTEDNAKNETGKKTLEEPTQIVERSRVREMVDGTKWHAPRAKTLKNVKAM